MEGLELKYEFNSLQEFFVSCEKLEPEGDPFKHKERLQEEDVEFFGKTIKSIKENKYSYKEGLSKLKSISDINRVAIGGSNRKKKWNEIDGYELSQERLYDGRLPLLDKQKSIGKGKSGRFITLKINIGEPCYILAEQMLWKSYTAAKLADQLEQKGYRLKIMICHYTTDTGKFRDQNIDVYKLEITIKDFNQGFNVSSLLAVTTPWFMRYWGLAFKASKFKPHLGYGRPMPLGESSTEKIIIIDKGQCLSKKGGDNKIKTIMQEIHGTT